MLDIITKTAKKIGKQLKVILDVITILLLVA